MKGKETIKASKHLLEIRHRERPEVEWQSIQIDCFGFVPQPRNDERNRMPARCLKATAKDSRTIRKLVFEEALYSLLSALADGQISNAVRSGDADRFAGRKPDSVRMTCRR